MRLAVPSIMVLLSMAVAGCGSQSSRSQEEIQRGKQAIEVSLESWKRGESIDKLKKQPDGVDFSDDWRKTNSLVDFAVLGSTAADAATITFAVRLTLKDKKGKTEEVEAKYVVVLGSPTKVSRDPFN